MSAARSEAPSIAGGDKHKAEQMAEDLVKIDPARGYLALGEVARKQNEKSKIFDAYRKAVDANCNACADPNDRVGKTAGHPTEAIVFRVGRAEGRSVDLRASLTSTKIQAVSTDVVNRARWIASRAKLKFDPGGIATVGPLVLPGSQNIPPIGKPSF